MYMKNMEIVFAKIDYFGRPVFMADGCNCYLCDTDNLFNWDVTEKRVMEFYKQHPEALQCLTTKHGTEGEPTGYTVPEKVELISKKEYIKRHKI